MTLRMNTRIAATLLAAAIGAGAAGVALANPATDEQSEITAVAAARTAPADAVRAAEQKTGGRAVEMGLEKKANTAGYYEVLVALPDGISEVRIDPATGAVQSASQPAPRKLEDVRASELGQVTAAPVKLGDAIAAAEKKAGGRSKRAIPSRIAAWWRWSRCRRTTRCTKSRWMATTRSRSAWPLPPQATGMARTAPTNSPRQRVVSVETRWRRAAQGRHPPWSGLPRATPRRQRRG